MERCAKKEKGEKKKRLDRASIVRDVHLSSIGFTTYRVTGEITGEVFAALLATSKMA